MSNKRDLQHCRVILAFPYLSWNWVSMAQICYMCVLAKRHMGRAGKKHISLQHSKVKQRMGNSGLHISCLGIMQETDRRKILSNPCPNSVTICPIILIS